jgi:hypothetical protein
MTYFIDKPLISGYSIFGTRNLYINMSLIKSNDKTKWLIFLSYFTINDDDLRETEADLSQIFTYKSMGDNNDTRK